MYQSGQWEDYQCTHQLQAICVNLTGSSETFVLTNDSFTWEEAQQYCRQHHTDLASVKDATQNSQIAALVPSGNAWIGLNKAALEVAGWKQLHFLLLENPAA
ncbi:putative C-type lectin domain family 20 member A [Boleophthalmus pectinirostris]|uniref:putative C-type lectin domain family 20 member A n=1 Tax=Boleophthalmus pectinirostris TaxID=150288 RepID=UPI002430F926|nr:putative C-type lectin domain family 20 member A [Boleophthalmus pectinirostris]